MVKIGKYSRSVSIIGVGATPFVNVVGNPDWEGITESELFAMASLEAMKDAGVSPQDVDFFFHGQCFPGAYSDAATPAIHYADWIGMRGKGNLHHSEGCCTGYLALDVAVNAVASGKYDIVLSGGIEMCDSTPNPNGLSSNRNEMDMSTLLVTLNQLWSRDYIRPFGSDGICFDIEMEAYARENNLNDKAVHEVLGAMAKTARRHSAMNPKALKQTTLEDDAKAMGFNDVDEFLYSDFNPHLGQFLRISDSEARASGASAVIVCPTEMAYKFKKNPIEVVGIGHASLEGMNEHVEKRSTEMAVEQVYQATGLSGGDLDLLLANDFFITSELVAAEATGYLPKNEAWKYFLEGRTAFDAEKPINTNGGRAAYGHAYAASGLADLYEAVHQMRGDCGEHQIPKPVNTVMIRGFGGGQNVTATILRNAIKKEG